MKFTGIARFALQAVITAGINGVLTNVIKSTTPADPSNIKKIFDKMGEYAITGAVAGYITEKTISEIEELLSIAIPDKKEPISVKQPESSSAFICTDSVALSKGMTVEEFKEFNRKYVEEIMKEINGNQTK
jgi:hypothetical protein